MHAIYRHFIIAALCLIHAAACQQPGELDAAEATSRLRELAKQNQFDSFQDYYDHRKLLHQIAALELDVEPSLLIDVAQKFSGTRERYLSFDALFAYRSCVGDREYLLRNFRDQTNDRNLAAYSLIVLSCDVDDDLLVEVERIGNPAESSKVAWAINICRSTYEAKSRLDKLDETSEQVYYLCRIIWRDWGSTPFDIYFRMRPASVWARETFMVICQESPEAVARAIAENVGTFTKRTGIEDVAFIKALCSEDVRRLIESYGEARDQGTSRPRP